jgi:hypothetical protein
MSTSTEQYINRALETLTGLRTPYDDQTPAASTYGGAIFVLLNIKNQFRPAELTAATTHDAGMGTIPVRTAKRICEAFARERLLDNLGEAANDHVGGRKPHLYVQRPELIDFAIEYNTLYGREAADVMRMTVGELVFNGLQRYAERLPAPISTFTLPGVVYDIAGAEQAHPQAVLHSAMHEMLAPVGRRAVGNGINNIVRQAV